MKNENSNQNNIFLKAALSFLVCLFLFGSGAFAFWFFQEKMSKEVVPAKPSPKEAPLHQEKITIITEPSPSLAPEKSDLELITEAMAARHSSSVSDTIINIGKQSGSHASGGVRFEGEMGGGWFLAYKGNDGWIIVQDGNGTITCETIEPYNFPVDMAPECVDQHGNLITR
jgi:hypothetical protein